MPEGEFQSWTRHGFTHIWLMGVWTAGPRAAQIAKSQTSLQKWAEARKTSTGHRSHPEREGAATNLIAASPYAIASYEVAPEFGGEKALAVFRKKLKTAGLKLVLDFVPNHIGIDHIWLEERPELFVHAKEVEEGTFPVRKGRDSIFLAHGKDPNFSPWTDTAQLDYRVAATHEAMREVLGSIAERCDGVRCDMAMLVLRDVFERTWQVFPAAATAPGEFWPEAIRSVKERFPSFMFLAEAYWGLETTLLDMGFDYAYDKVLYDRLVQGDGRAACAHIYSQSARQIERSVHFIENHDEQRASAVLPLDRHRAAAMVVLSLPGMRFLHEGQLTGAKQHLPVQAAERFADLVDPEVQAMYEDLLDAIVKSDVGRGSWALVKFDPPEAAVLGIHWFQEQMGSSQADGPLSPGTFLAVNLASTEADVPLAATDPNAGWLFLGHSPGTALRVSGSEQVVLSLPGYGWALLQICPFGRQRQITGSESIPSRV